MCADPSAHQNVLIEMSGLDRRETTEVSEGLYQLTLLNKDGAPCVQAILPFKWVAWAQRSPTLFVSVKDPKHVPPLLTIHGNAIAADAASGEAKVVWSEPKP